MQKHLLNLPIDDLCQVTYVWLDIDFCFRSKTRTLKDGDQITKWEHDDLGLLPIATFRDPFIAGGILALCQTFDIQDGSLEFNDSRKNALNLLEEVKKHHPLFRIEMEVGIIGYKNIINEENIKDCGIGHKKVPHRELIDVFYRCCLFATIKLDYAYPSSHSDSFIFGIKQMKGIEICDNVVMALYILKRLVEYEKKEMTNTFLIKVFYSINSSRKKDDTGREITNTMVRILNEMEEYEVNKEGSGVISILGEIDELNLYSYVSKIVNITI